MVGFVRKKVKSYTLAEKLKRVREQHGISLSEISKATKIRKVYLEKIEEGKYDQLPADVYIKGFLRGYADYIGLDIKEVLKQYEKERGVLSNIKKTKTDDGEQNRLRRFRLPMVTITPRMATAVFFGVLVFAGFMYFYKEIGKLSETPRLVVMQPTSDTSISGSSIDVTGVTDKENKVTINGQPIYVNDSGQFKETLSLQKGLNSISVKSVNRFGKEIEKNFNISADYETKVAGSEDELVEDEFVGTEGGNQVVDKVRLEISIKDVPVWVSVEVDGKNVHSGTMLPGSVGSFEADNQIAVTSGKASMTMIKLNGQDLGQLNNSPGVVRDVIFTKETKMIPAPLEKEENSKDPGNSKKDKN